jgi:hypothetical protein
MWYIVVDRCSMGQTGDNARILVMPVEDWREIRARQRQRLATSAVDGEQPPVGNGH